MRVAPCWAQRGPTPRQRCKPCICFPPPSRKSKATLQSGVPRAVQVMNFYHWQRCGHGGSESVVSCSESKQYRFTCLIMPVQNVAFIYSLEFQSCNVLSPCRSRPICLRLIEGASHPQLYKWYRLFLCCALRFPTLNGAWSWPAGLLTLLDQPALSAYENTALLRDFDERQYKCREQG